MTDKVNIVNYFIMSAPPGQANDVLADVNKLVSDGVMTSDVVSKMLGNYNQTNFVQFDKEDGGKMLCSTYGKVDDSSFVDPSSGEVYTLDHLALKATKAGSQQNLSDKVEGFRKAIETEMTTYCEKQYKRGKAVCAVYGADDGKITICISGINKNLGNFWSGCWRSSFKLDVSGGNTQLECHGKVHGHYFEDGNVQLHAEKEKKVDVAVSDPAATAAAVVKAMGKWESDFQGSLEEMYVDMHENTFKAMRRMLPKTKTLFNWSQGAAHSLASEIAR